MRIMTWNINGIRTLPQYHPWNKHKTCENILKELAADIICFQEMKTSRASLEPQVAIPGDSFDAFFSFPTSKKGGYSGVAVFTNTQTAVVLKVEEGLTGLLSIPSSKSGTTRNNDCNNDINSSRISSTSGYPRADDPELDLLPLTAADEDKPESGFSNSKMTPQDEFLALDAEGRCLVVDFGLFVLVNLYCPNSDNASIRHAYKMNFHHILEERVRRLLADGREVIVVGDINICATPADHCDGHLPSNRDTFYDPPARQWFRRWIDEDEGVMVDVVRKCWPERKGMYTCWNTKISARETNYGTRIDYILLSKGLLPWLKHGDIMPSVRGSDHCPVFVDLHDEITTPGGEKKVLRDLMHMGHDVTKREPPKLCARYWPEFSRKQQKLSNFFGKGKKESSVAPLSVDLNSTPGPVTALIPDVVTVSSAISDQENANSVSPVADESNKSPIRPGEDMPHHSNELDAERESVEPSASSGVTTPLVEELPLSSQTPPPTVTPSSSLVSEPGVTQSPYSAVEGGDTRTKLVKHKRPLPDSNYDSISSISSSKRVKGEGKSKKAKRPSQTKLSNFFGSESFNKPGTFDSGKSSRSKGDSQRCKGSESVLVVEGGKKIYDNPEVEELDGPKASSSKSAAAGMPYNVDDEDMDAFLLAEGEAQSQPLSLSQSSLPSSQPQSQQSTSSQQSWTALFARVDPPRCTVHNEPAREFTVNKPGPNRGKKFYLCSRPVGPGYDAGKDKRRREEVDHQYKCNYFKWASEVKKEALKANCNAGELTPSQSGVGKTNEKG